MIRLTRFAHTPFGTFGLLKLDETTSLYTLEDQWDDNWPKTSCIPPHPESNPLTYEIHRDFTGRHQHYALAEVPGRTAIEIHAGNTTADTEGCILVGLGLGWLNDRWALADSRKAIDVLHDKLGDNSHILLIAWSFDLPRSPR